MEIMLCRDLLGLDSSCGSIFLGIAVIIFVFVAGLVAFKVLIE